MYTLPKAFPWERTMNTQKRQTATTWDAFSRWVQKELFVRK